MARQCCLRPIMSHEDHFGRSRAHSSGHEDQRFKAFMGSLWAPVAQCTRNAFHGVREQSIRRCPRHNPCLMLPELLKPGCGNASTSDSSKYEREPPLDTVPRVSTKQGAASVTHLLSATISHSLTVLSFEALTSRRLSADHAT